MRIASILGAAAVLAALGACTAKTKTPKKATDLAALPGVKKGGPVIARFDGRTLTADEVTAKLDQRSPFERAQLRTLARKRQFVEQMVRFQLLADEAQRQGLDKDPEVLQAMKSMMVRKLIQRDIDNNPAKKKFTDAELKSYYQAHLSEFQRPEMVRLQAIVLRAKSLAGAKKRLAEAKRLIKKLRANQRDYSAFGLMVAQKSEDPATKKQNGDLRFLSKNQLAQKYGPQVAKAGFALTRQGSIAAPVLTPKGVYILRLTGRTPPLNTTFAKAKPMLKQRLWYQKRSKLFDQLVAKLKKKAHYSLNEKALAQLQVDTTAPTDFSAVGAPGSIQPPRPAHPLQIHRHIPVAAPQAAHAARPIPAHAGK